MTALSKVHQPGGTAAAAAAQVGWNRPMAGKTGTTQQHKSAAFVGVVPQMAGAVIVFDNSNSPRPLCDSAGAPFPCRDGNVFGGNTPAGPGSAAMKPLLDPLPVEPLPPTDPRYVEGGAESKVPDVIGRGLNDARAILDGPGGRPAQTPSTTAPTRAPSSGRTPTAPRCPARPSSSRSAAARSHHHRPLPVDDPSPVRGAPDWVTHYNTRRAHSALGGRPPITRLAA